MSATAINAAARVSQKDFVHAALRHDIVTGTLRPGAALTDTRVAEDYGFTIASVRAAVQTLRHEGLVLVRPRQGSYVRTVDHGRTREALHAIQSAVESAVHLSPAILRPRSIRLMQHRADALGLAEHGHDAAAELLDLYEPLLGESGNPYLQQFFAITAAHLCQAAAVTGAGGFGHSAARGFATALEHGTVADAVTALRDHFAHVAERFARAHTARCG
ncbi:hypothetical protein BMH32_05855 [Leucobacter sp. OLJS4]|uniref:GntR family transcriptional regulator n=1 Tax=unclassified Leucobacter TaxID=2621730 RepID=UPI000C187873|nr:MULTISPECIES: GntR family transcriptional regulator [unclassified Leucobacter]PIJ54402.1 hypothetical protein BMH30_02095 [Leucobacter sp. OLES1]PII86728.1 hypothetical protein BMH25_00850 [Leucobacter sp. OLCALW19]PII88945.1 hypothetical protein BMH27_14990 [Leucobacter sp. OLAS13]PII96034.1 hypothetical protein BMH26_00760 [Leucobacter sp. OLTLW20]PII96796.1 hypothetical protein BMH28_14435 [Leucobacter sp. OLCS4]